MSDISVSGKFPKPLIESMLKVVREDIKVAEERGPYDVNGFLTIDDEARINRLRKLRATLEVATLFEWEAYLTIDGRMARTFYNIYKKACPK
jgi:hypothetical protein